MLDPVVAALARLPEPIFVAVNVTGQTLTRTAYADLVTDALSTHGVRPGRLHLEITETMLLALNDDVVGPDAHARRPRLPVVRRRLRHRATRRSATCATCRSPA